MRFLWSLRKRFCVNCEQSETSGKGSLKHPWQWEICVVWEVYKGRCLCRVSERKEVLVNSSVGGLFGGL